MAYILNKHGCECLYRYTGYWDHGNGWYSLHNYWVVSEEKPDIELLEDWGNLYRFWDGTIEKFDIGDYSEFEQTILDDDETIYWVNNREIMEEAYENHDYSHIREKFVKGKW